MVAPCALLANIEFYVVTWFKIAKVKFRLIGILIVRIGHKLEEAYRTVPDSDIAIYGDGVEVWLEAFTGICDRRGDVIFLNGIGVRRRLSGRAAIFGIVLAVDAHKSYSTE